MGRHTRSIRFPCSSTNTGHRTLHPTLDHLTLYIHSVYTVPYLFNCSFYGYKHSTRSLYTAHGSYSLLCWSWYIQDASPCIRTPLDIVGTILVEQPCGIPTRKLEQKVYFVAGSDSTKTDSIESGTERTLTLVYTCARIGCLSTRRKAEAVR